MKFLAILTVLGSATHVLGACAASGAANGECVRYWGGSNCDGEKLGTYGRTCGGNCFQYDSFSSIHVDGDGTYGTNCYAYSDINCSSYMGSTGNVKFAPGKCSSFPGAKSMKCFYRC